MNLFTYYFVNTLLGNLGLEIERASIRIAFQSVKFLLAIIDTEGHFYHVV